MNFEIPTEFITVFLSVIGTATATYFSIKNNRKSSNSLDMLEKLYLPLNNIIVFKEMDYGDNLESLRIFCLKIQPIIENNSTYVSRLLLNRYLNLKGCIKEHNYNLALVEFNYISAQIEKEYDRLRRNAGLPNNGLRYLFSTLNGREKAMFISLFAFGIVVSTYAIISLIVKIYNAYSSTSDMFIYEKMFWKSVTIFSLMILSCITIRLFSKK